MNVDAATAASTADLGAFWSAAISALIAVFISAGELYDNIPRSRLNLLMRWQSLLYILLNVMFAVAALLALRYLTVPNSRTAELEQIALAGVSARFALTRALGAKSSRKRSKSGDAGVTTSLFDTVMTRIIADLKGGENRRVAHLLAAFSPLSYENVSQVFVPTLTAQVVQFLDQEKKQEFNRNITEIAKQSVGDSDGARDTLLLLIIGLAGEDWLRDVCIVYTKRFPNEAKYVEPVYKRFDVAAPRWNFAQRSRRKNYLKQVKAEKKAAVGAGAVGTNVRAGAGEAAQSEVSRPVPAAPGVAGSDGGPPGRPETDS